MKKKKKRERYGAILRKLSQGRKMRSQDVVYKVKISSEVLLFTIIVWEYMRMKCSPCEKYLYTKEFFIFGLL